MKKLLVQVGSTLQKNDLKNIREYLNGIVLCYQVSSEFYKEIKEVSKDKPESFIEIFMQHDFQSAFKPMTSKYMIC